MYKLSAEEKETHISLSFMSDETKIKNGLDLDTNYWSVYTTDQVMMRKLKRKGYTPYKVEYMADYMSEEEKAENKDNEVEKQVIAEYYYIHMKGLTINKKERKKVEMSEERLKELREKGARLSQLRKKNKENQENQ